MNRVTLPLFALLLTAFAVGCAANEEETDSISSESSTEESAPAIPKWSEVKPILANTCGSCHRPTAFSTVTKVKEQRDAMLERLSAGLMPQDNPTWAASDDGQKVLAYLKNSPDFN